MKRALAERVKQEMEGPMANGPPEVANHHLGMNGMNNGLPPANIMPRMMTEASSSLSPPMPMSAPVSASPIDHNAIMGGVGMELSNRQDAGITTNTITSSTPSKKRPRSPNASSSGNVSAFQAQKSSDDENESTPKGSSRHRSSKQSANNNSDDEEGDDSNSTFYLKHQNQSLASELYAYRRKIYLLEKERDYRRKECRIAGKRIGELRGAWRGLEEALGQEMATVNLPQASEVCFLLCFVLFLLIMRLVLN